MLFVCENGTERLNISIVKHIGCSGVTKIKESKSLTFSNESFYSIAITGLCETNLSQRSVAYISLLMVVARTTHATKGVIIGRLVVVGLTQLNIGLGARPLYQCEIILD